MVQVTQLQLMKKVVHNYRILPPLNKYLVRHPVVPPEPVLSWGYSQSPESYRSSEGSSSPSLGSKKIPPSIYHVTEAATRWITFVAFFFRDPGLLEVRADNRLNIDCWFEGKLSGWFPNSNGRSTPSQVDTPLVRIGTARCEQSP